VYPPENAELQHAIGERGLLMASLRAARIFLVATG
jgi:hypothetical protein